MSFLPELSDEPLRELSSETKSMSVTNIRLAVKPHEKQSALVVPDRHRGLLDPATLRAVESTLAVINGLSSMHVLSQDPVSARLLPSSAGGLPSEWSPEDLSDAGRRYVTATWSAISDLKNAKMPGTKHPRTLRAFSVDDVSEYLERVPLESKVTLPLPTSLDIKSDATEEEIKLTQRYNELQEEIKELHFGDKQFAKDLWTRRFEQHRILADLEYGSISSGAGDTSISSRSKGGASASTRPASGHKSGSSNSKRPETNAGSTAASLAHEGSVGTVEDVTAALQNLNTQDSVPSILSVPPAEEASDDGAGDDQAGDAPAVSELNARAERPKSTSRLLTSLNCFRRAP